MARIRSVKPELCTSETMAHVSATAERTFVRLWTNCDDEGRCLATPKLLKAALYPLHDDVDVAAIERDLDELAQAALIVRYEASGKQYLAVRSWKEHQKPQHPSPSKLPAPPERLMSSPEDGVKPPDAIGSPTEDEVLVVEGEVSSTAPEDVMSAPDVVRSLAELTVTDEMREWARGLRFADDQIDTETRRFIDWHRSHDTSSADWRATWRLWFTGKNAPTPAGDAKPTKNAIDTSDLHRCWCGAWLGTRDGESMCTDGHVQAVSA